MRPLSDRVLVKPLEADDKTEGGIVLPDNAKEKPQKGTVIALGPGRLLSDGTHTEMAVSIGDVVLFGRYAGTEIKVKGEEFCIMCESDILAVLSAEPG